MLPPSPTPCPPSLYPKQALVTSTHQEKFLQQAQQLQQHLLQELTATADSHSRQMQLLFRWCIALKAIAAVTPAATTGQPVQLIDPLTISLELLPAIALAASHMQQLRLLSVLGPLDQPDASSSSSSSSSSCVQLPAVAAAYMSVVPSAVEAVLCLQDGMLLSDKQAAKKLLQRSSINFTYDSLKLLLRSSDLLLSLSLSQLIYFGSKLVHSFLQQQQQQQQQCRAAAASQSNTTSSSSSSSSCWSVAEGLLLSRVDVLQSAATTTSQAAALLQHSSRMFEQQWRQLGYPSLTTLTQCDDMSAATLSSSSSSSGGNSSNSNDDVSLKQRKLVQNLRNVLTLNHVLRNSTKTPPRESQLRAVASMVLSVASAAVGIAGTESVRHSMLVEAMLLVEVCIKCFSSCLDTSKPELHPPAEPAASSQEGCEGPDGSSSSSSGAKGAAATQQQQQQQQAPRTSSCADVAVSDELLTGQLVHLVQQLVHLTPPASTSFVGNSAAANRESSAVSKNNSGGPGSSSSSSSSSSGGSGGSSKNKSGGPDSSSSSGSDSSKDNSGGPGSSSGSGGSRSSDDSRGCGSGCDVGDGRCIHMLSTSNLKNCLLRLARMLQPLLGTQRGAVISRMHQPSYLLQITCVLQGMEAAVRVLVPLLMAPANRYVINTPEWDAGAGPGQEQPKILYPGTNDIDIDPVAMTAMFDLSAVMLNSAQTLGWLTSLLKAPGGWEVLTETVPGQQLLQAWLSLHATTSKDYVLISAASTGTPCVGPSVVVDQSLLVCVTYQLHAALAAQELTEQQQQQQQQQQQEQQQPPPQQQPSIQQQQQLQAAQLPDPQLVSVVLMQAAHYHFSLAEELNAISAAIEGPARDCSGNGHPAPGMFNTAKVVVAFFSTQDATSPPKPALKLPQLLQNPIAQCSSFARYSASLQGLLQALVSLRDAVAGSAGGLQTSSCSCESQDMVQQLSGQGAAGGLAAASSSCGDQQLVQQWAAVFEAWVVLGDVPLEQLLQADAGLLQAAVASAAVQMQEWQQFVEEATGTGAHSASAAGGSRRTRKTSKQHKPLSLPPLVEKVLGAMKALEEALLRRGQLLSLLIPSRYCCNYPGCGNMAGPSESFYLVRGRSCVCGGCVSQQQLDADTGHTLAAR